MMINPWIARYIENHKSKLRSYHDQENSYYRREELAIGAHYAAEREKFKAESARDLQHLRHSQNVDINNLNHSHNLHAQGLKHSQDLDIQGLKHSQDLNIQNTRHSQQLEIEESRSGLAKWIEEFRQKTGLKIESKRQEGAQILQEREHVHRRLIIELEQAEHRARSDEDYARSLELAKKTDELAAFQRQREAVYALEAQRFAGIIAERQTYNAAIVSEFASRNDTGKAAISALSSLLVNSSSANDKLNEMILAAVIAKHARAEERKAAREAEAGKAVDRVVDGWKRGDDGNG